MFDQRKDQPIIYFPLFDGMGHKIHSFESKVEDEPSICPPTSPNERRNYYRSLSFTSKTEAIERGQNELMEMVRNMPESSYELTLKDIVEQPKVDDVEEEEMKLRDKILSNKNVHEKESVVSRKVEKKGSISSSNKIDSEGLYLKMVLPISQGSKKNKKKKDSSANNKSSSCGGESESGVSSMNSRSMKSSGSSNSSRHEIIKGDSCWRFILRRPKK